ncbi:MAG TPA: AsmA-like C-terminal region-containing protein [Burkholderiales bacterium]
MVERLRIEIPGKLDAQVGRTEVELGLWPLLHGEVVLTALHAEDAHVRVVLQPTAGATQAAPRAQPANPVNAVRQGLGAAARVLREYAPEMELSMARGRFDLVIGDQAVLALRGIDVRARSAGARVQLRLTCESEHWRRLELEGQFDEAGATGRVSASVAALDPRAWLGPLLAPTGVRLSVAPADLRATLQSDGAAALTGSVDARTSAIQVGADSRTLDVPAVSVAVSLRVEAQRAQAELRELRVDGERLFHGSVEYAAASGDAQGRFVFDIEAARALGLARRVLGGAGGLQEVEGAQGRLRGEAQVARADGRWRARLQLHDAESSWQVRSLPWPVVLGAGSVAWQPGRVSASGIQAVLGRSSVSGLGAELLIGKELRLESATGAARAALDQLYPWLRQQAALESALREIPAVTGMLEARLLRAAGKLDSPEYEIGLVPRAVRVAASPLPAPLLLEGGEARVTRSGLSVREVTLALLDARAKLSGNAREIGTREFRVQAQIAEGRAGSESVNWGLARAKAPAQLSLRAPFDFSVQRLDWGPGRRLGASAEIRFDADTRVAAEASWEPDALALERLEVQDGRGTGRLALQLRKRLLEGRFSGEAHGAVLAYFLKDASRYAGRVAGDARFSADLDSLRHATLEGRLSGEGLDLAWLAGRPLLVEKFSLDAQRGTARVSELVLRAGEQAATLRGDFRRGERGPVVDATIETRGIVVDDLLPQKPSAGERETAAAKEGVASDPAAARRAEAELAALPRAPGVWPLPVTGRVALHAGFVQHGQLRAEPVDATLTLEEQRALLEVSRAQLCGIALPFTLEVRPEGWRGAVRLAASKRPVGELAQCLTAGRVQMTGNVEAAVEVETQGRASELLRNLKGRGSVEVVDGHMQRFALVGNILSLLNIADVAETVRGEATGFRFTRIGGTGHIRDGGFVLEEGVFDSPSARMAANGTIRLGDGESKITVLVAPLGRVDRVVRGIPIFGYVIGGTLTSIPVGVSGDIRDPLVVPLGPRAVTEELLGVFQRALKLPEKLAPPPVSK